MSNAAALQELNVLIAQGERWMKQAYRVREKLAGDSSPASALPALSSKAAAEIIAKRRMARGNKATKK